MAKKGTTVRVVGMSFRPTYPENMHRLSEVLDQEQARGILGVTGWDEVDGEVEGPRVLLIHNPDNEHDSNAIEVHIPALGRIGWVGHVPAALAARWAPRLDRGEIAEASVTDVPIDPAHLDKPGLEIKVKFHTDCALRSGGEFCTCGESTPDWTRR